MTSRPVGQEGHCSLVVYEDSGFFALFQTLPPPT